LFNYRVSGSVEYYNRITDNLLFEVPLALSSGLDSYNANIGSMYNRGIEVDLTTYRVAEMFPDRIEADLIVATTSLPPEVEEKVKIRRLF